MKGSLHSGSLIDLELSINCWKRKVHGSHTRAKWSSREAAKQHLIDNPDVAEELTQLIMEKVHPKGGESLTGDKEPAAETEESQHSQTSSIYGVICWRLDLCHLSRMVAWDYACQ